MNNRKLIAVLVLLAAIGMMARSGSQLIKAGRVYREGVAAYEALSRQVKKSPSIGTALKTAQTEKEADTGFIAAEEPQLSLPELEIDFQMLTTINKDAATWLYCPGTVIDYPVMKADDYDYYLHHLPDGTQNANGSLFIDYNCAADFSDPLTIIYGHHMKSGSMFGSLKGYKEQGYFEEHPYMYLYTQQGNYRIDLIYGCVIGAGQWRERAFTCAKNVKALIAYAAYNTTFKNGTVYEEGDRVVALSTCSYEFDDARYVLVGILRAVV